MVVSSAAGFGMSIMQTFQESTAQESSRVGAGGGGQAIIFREQGMTFGYISMTKKTLRIIHVLVGRINYLTGTSVHNRLDFHHSLKSGLRSSSRRAWAPFLKASGNQAYVHH